MYWANLRAPIFLLFIAFLPGFLYSPLSSADCNGNGIEDTDELSEESDCNLNGILDSCEASPEIQLRGNRRYFITDQSLVDIAEGDFDSDGNVDLAVLYSEGGFGIVFGDGQGGFELRTTINTQPTARELVSAHLNGDDLKDLCLLDDGLNELSFFINQGDGQFKEEKTLSITSRSSGLVAVDFTNDQRDDLVFVNSWNHRFSVLLNDENMDFTEKVELPLEASPTQPLVADFNDDLNMDLFLFSREGEQAHIYLGDGVGGFESVDNLSVPKFSTHGVITDFDVDGHSDVIISNAAEGTISLYLGLGNGSFQKDFSFEVEGRVSFLLEGDNNSDGFDDLLVFRIIDDQESLLIYQNDGLGAYSEPRTGFIGDDLNVAISIDAFGDLAEELLIGRHRNLTVVQAQEELGLLIPETYPGNFWPESIDTGDLNGDGRQDLVVLCYESDELKIYLGTPDGNYLLEKEISTGRNPAQVEVVDLDFDGWDDIVFGSHSGAGITIGWNAKNGGFQYSVLISPARESIQQFQIADLDRDGHLDLLGVSFHANSVVTFKGRGNRQLRFLEEFSVGGRPFFPHVIDVDEDGILDLATLNRLHGDSMITLALGRGDGKFEEPIHRELEGRAESMIHEDFNSDGHEDLIIEVWQSEHFLILLGQGDGTFTEVASVPNDDYVGRIHSADLNGDMHLDLIAFHARGPSAGYSVYRGNGDGTFNLPKSYAINGRANAIGVEDVNFDQRPDLLIGSLESNDVSVIINEAVFFSVEDCNLNGSKDGCDIGLGISLDVDQNGIPDECELDCNEDSIPDRIQVLNQTVRDCNNNFIPDSCEIANGELSDCNDNQHYDACEIREGLVSDENQNSIPDVCEPKGCWIPGDCNGDDLLDVSDAICELLIMFTGTPLKLPCGNGTIFEEPNIQLLDWQGDQRVDLSDPVAMLRYLFISSPPHILAVPGAEKTQCVTIINCPR